MSENKKFLLVFVIIILIFSGEKVFNSLTKKDGDEKPQDFKMVIEEHSYSEKSELLDINKATVDDMLAVKISLSIATKLIEYREITGGYNSLDEMNRISGIGTKTYEKLSMKLEVKNNIKKKKLNMNSATEKELKYYGFDKKEVKRIKEYIEENGYIFDNLTLIEVVGEERYEVIKEYASY